MVIPDAYSQVITSDLGGTVGPSGAAAYDAVHRLYLADGMPSGAKVIIFGWGMTGPYEDLSDLIDLGYYQRGFAFFSPAGSGGTAQWLGVLVPANKPEVFDATAGLSPMSPHPAVHDGPEVDGIAFAPTVVSGQGGSLCMRAFVQRLGSIVALTLLACRR